MYEILIEIFIDRPGRLSAIGRTLFQMCAMIVLVSLGLRIAGTGMSAIQRMSGAVPRDTSLAVLYPSLPTWWIPESIFGYVACLLFALLGLMLVQMGRDIDRAIR